MHDLLEEARDGFKEVGEGVKKLTTWEDLSVRCWIYSPLSFRLRN